MIEQKWKGIGFFWYIKIIWNPASIYSVFISIPVMLSCLHIVYNCSHSTKAELSSLNSCDWYCIWLLKSNIFIICLVIETKKNCQTLACNIVWYKVNAINCCLLLLLIHFLSQSNTLTWNLAWTSPNIKAKWK